MRIEKVGRGSKRILIISGVHGNELTPIVCCSLLHDTGFIGLEDKFNKITLITNVNAAGLRECSRTTPGRLANDPNRLDIKDGVEQVELLELIKQHDMIIDVHSSYSCAEMILIDQDELANSYVLYAKANDIKYCVRYSSANTIKKVCNLQGKVGFTVELNGMIHPDMASAKKGVELLKKLIINDLIPSKSEPANETYVELLTHHEGIFIPTKGMGDIIDEGDVVGEILNVKTLVKKPIVWTKQKGVIVAGNDEGNYIVPGKYIYWVQPL